jgi:hypothetical protein
MAMTNRFVASAIAAGLLATTASAQSANAGPRWSAYAGCWAATAVEGQTVVGTAPEICIVPTGDFGADLLSLTNKKVSDRTHVEADAVHHDIDRQGCSGWESALWSPDGRRLYFNSDQRCDGGLQRKGSGIFAISAAGVFTNVVNVAAGGGQGLRVLRYAPIKVDSTYPADIVASFGNRETSMSTARIAARADIQIPDVIDATKMVGPAVTQAWIATTGQKFDLDAKGLVRLADAGVSPETIDIMIAVSNPQVFAVAPRTAEPSSAQARRDAERLATADCYDRMMDPWGYYDYGFCDPYSRYGYYGSRLGYGYGLYGYDPFRGGYGYGYGYGYVYNSNPVVVVVKENQTPHGKMTRNGYSNPSASTSSTADRTPSATSSASSSGSGSSTSSGGSPSGSSSGGGRTAHAKPPA